MSQLGCFLIWRLERPHPVRRRRTGLSQRERQNGFPLPLGEGQGEGK